MTHQTNLTSTNELGDLMSMELENVIVGSGPAAYICALELIRNGQNFTVITPKLESSESSMDRLQPNASKKMIFA